MFDTVIGKKLTDEIFHRRCECLKTPRIANLPKIVKKKLEKLALVHYTFERHKHTVQSTKSYKMSRSISGSDILEVTNF